VARPPTSLHLTNAWHASSGGIRTFYLALIDAAVREGRRVALVVPGARTDTQELGPHGCLYTLAAPPAPAFDRRYRTIYPHRYLPYVGRAVARILARGRPDLVEICDKYSLPYLAALLRRRFIPGLERPPVIVGLSCERFDDNMAAYLNASRAARGFTQWYIRHVYGPPFDVHVANSEYTARELRAALHDRAAGFVRVQPMGVDVHAFGPERRSRAVRDRLRGLLGLAEDAVLLFYAGRVSPEKNLDLLIEALRELPQVDSARRYGLVIAGDGPRAAELRTLGAGPLRGRLALCGNLDRETLAACYASADVFVHPNPREPFGIGPLEAMASGVPVVLPDAGGVLEYAGPHNAWLAPPEGRAFAAAIVAAAAGDPERLAAARATARAFAWEQSTARYFALQDELVSRSRIGATPEESKAAAAPWSGPIERDTP
jgi:alpha-1,6-mannosyltransferase